MAKSEGQKSAGKAAKKATKAKKALKRMVSEIDAEDTSEYAYCFARACCSIGLWASTSVCLCQSCFASQILSDHASNASKCMLPSS